MENYQQYSDKDLKRSLWYVSHKIILKNIFLGVLFFLNLVVWGYVLFGLVLTCGVNLSGYRDVQYGIVVDETLNQEYLLEQTRPKNISTQSIKTLPSGSGRIDALALVKNPNQFWGATFTYQFVGQGTGFSKRIGFILPGQEKYLYDLDVEASEVSEVVISDVVWTRYNDFVEQQKIHEKIALSDVVFTPAGSDVGSTSAVTATVTNNTTFDYYEPTFFVTLLRGGEVVAAQSLTIDELRSGQSRTLDVRWVESVPALTEIGIFSDINYLSPEAFIKL
ncbi:hypothetical protein IT409_03115 [Candidatus Falkowbacteria bacterium]|nr:hypothetical protein [Candidatus Falkowbacteria bacterium]